MRDAYKGQNVPPEAERKTERGEGLGEEGNTTAFVACAIGLVHVTREEATGNAAYGRARRSPNCEAAQFE